ncbi:MAG: PA14 domain-containing protein [Planctomycetota bacterium]
MSRALFGPAIGAAFLAVASVLGAQESDDERVVATRADVLPRIDDLLARHDCLACHDPDAIARERIDPVLAPTLEGIATRVDPAWMEDFLVDPRGLRPGTTHPHQLAGIPESNRATVARDLVQFLVSTDETEGDAAPDDAVVTSDVYELELGRTLFHRVGCVACHGPLESPLDLELSLAELEEVELFEEDGEGEAPAPVRSGVLEPDPVLLPPDLARKYTVPSLARVLIDPVAVRPSGHCPSMGLSSQEARAIAVYLLLDQARGPGGALERRPGLFLRAYDLEGEPKELATLDSLEPVATSTARAIDVEARPSDDAFGLRFSGFLSIPADGSYTFHLRSDDGSRLRVGGQLVVDNGGQHAPETRSGSVDLFAGTVPIEITYFEAGGGEELSLEWEGAGVDRGEHAEVMSHWVLEHRVVGADGEAVSPERPVIDPEDADRGRNAFEKLGCAACHAGVSDASAAEVAASPIAPTLETLSGARPGVLVCLRPDGRYDFEADDVSGLIAAFVRPDTIADDTTSPTRSVERWLAGRRCYSCHRRDGIGGVHPDRAPYYQGDEDAELGDQGRFPPTLTAVGRKFRPKVLRAALRGEERVRPYLSTRMPRIGRKNASGIADRLAVLDRAATSSAPVDCGFEVVESGRRLAGDRGGLGCVQCHSFLGTKSLGIQAVDLGEMHRRLEFGWFRELLLDPASVDLEARMANLWVDGESPVTDIADGDVERQIEALWCWLGERETMAPPPGLDAGPWAYEIDTSERTRTIAVFMKDVSPRVLCVGTPERVHYAFDEHNVRLAKAWRGRFLNVEGTWRGRAGQLESPASNDVLDLPEGLALQPLADLYAAWPEATGSDAGARMRGRTRNDDGSVTIRYGVEGFEVEETISASRVAGEIDRTGAAPEFAGIERRVTVRARAGAERKSIVARLGVARQIDRIAPGRWRLGGPDGTLLEVDRTNARVARKVDPVERRTTPFGAPDDQRPLPDVRERDVRNERPTTPSRGLQEIRVPVLLEPDAAGAPGDLVGTLTWRIAW